MMRHLAGAMLRDLDAIERQIVAYPEEAALWQKVPRIPNSAGNLVLHLTGNLQHLVGAVLGGSGYVRDREAEFGRREVPRAELLAALEATRQAVDTTLPRLTEAVLESEFPIVVGASRVTTGEFLAHLLSHLGYHIGQIDTHRRIVTNDPRGAGAESIAGLRSARPA
jgi:uncharacterized damage-inducible protein DinB